MNYIFRCAKNNRNARVCNKFTVANYGVTRNAITQQCNRHCVAVAPAVAAAAAATHMHEIGGGLGHGVSHVLQLRTKLPRIGYHHKCVCMRLFVTAGRWNF